MPRYRCSDGLCGAPDCRRCFPGNFSEEDDLDLDRKMDEIDDICDRRREAKLSNGRQ